MQNIKLLLSLAHIWHAPNSPTVNLGKQAVQTKFTSNLLWNSTVPTVKPWTFFDNMQHRTTVTICNKEQQQAKQQTSEPLWTTHIVSSNEPLSVCLLKFKVQHSTWWPHSALHLSAPKVLGFLNSNVNDMETQIWDWCPSAKQSIKEHPAPKHPDLVLSRVKNGAAITKSTFTTFGPARDEEWKWQRWHGNYTRWNNTKIANKSPIFFEKNMTQTNKC